MSRLFLLALVGVLLTGCAAQPVIEPVATPQVVRVVLSGTLDWMRPTMAECSQEDSGLSLSVETIGVPDQSLDEADVLLRWSNQPPSDGFAVELGDDSLTVIVHPDNPIGDLDAGVIKDMYTGQISNWPAANGEATLAVHPWVLPVQDEAQALFETILMGGEQIVKTAMIAPSPAAMVEAIASDPLAIGFLPTRTLDSSVKSIEILNFSPSDLILPILAVTKSEPGGVVRDWLLCVQERINPN